MSSDHIGLRCLVGTQVALDARHFPQEISSRPWFADGIIGKRFDASEHQLARHVLVEHGAILVKVQEAILVEHRQRERHGKSVARCDIAVNVAERVALRMLLGLLEAKFDDEFEEILRAECARKVRCFCAANKD